MSLSSVLTFDRQALFLKRQKYTQTFTFTLIKAALGPLYAFKKTYLKSLPLLGHFQGRFKWSVQYLIQVMRVFGPLVYYWARVYLVGCKSLR